MDFRTYFYFLSVLIVLDAITLSEGVNLIIKTSKGRVRGVLIDSKVNSSNQMLVFKGIPYAQSPEGVRRFKAPLEVSSWRGTKALNADDKPACPQPSSSSFTGLMGYDENCLFVNVYCPSTVTPTSNLPVMVWIHGGGFIVGSGQYHLFGPDHLVDQNVIVVTFNYRLGALGFLSVGTEDAPGNAGLKDQAFALRWVNTEISAFGGDPGNVTIFGESAGSASVHFHILSNISKGLFQRAIAESGAALSNWAFLKTGYVEKAKQLSDALNCSTADNEINVTCLQQTPVEHILDKQIISLSEEERIPGSILAFTPVLDNNATTKPFFSDIPEKLTADPPNNVPLIMGTNQDEGIRFLSTDGNYYSSLSTKMQYFIPKETRQLIDNYTISDKVSKIKQFYFNGSSPSLENIQGYINLMTDKMFAVSTAVTAKALLKNNTVYLYRFDFNGGFQLPDPIKALFNVSGADHQDELGYIFVSSLINTENYSKDSPEMKTLRQMVKLWTNFAKFGTPTVDNSDPDLGNTSWLPISNNATNYLNINGNLMMSTDNYMQLSLEFWDDIDSTVNVSPTPVTPPKPTTPAPTKPASTTPATPAPTKPTPAPTKPTPAPTKPASTTPATLAPTKPTPAPTKPASTTPATPAPTKPTPAPTKPASTTPATPAPTKPASTTPATLAPTKPTPAPTKPASTTPATPAPTKPTPAPTKPASTTPATPAPTAPTPAPTKPASTTPATPAPTAPDPTTPALTTPAPTTQAPSTPAPTKPASTTPTVQTTPTKITIPPTPPPSSASFVRFNTFTVFFSIVLIVNVL